MQHRLIAVVCLVSAAGCGSRGYDLAAVSGTVTLDNKPLAGVHVTFVPLGTKEAPDPGPGSHGVTDANGQFTLLATTGKPGAVVGKHRVSIEASQRDESSTEQSDGAESEEAFMRRLAAANAVPARYNRETMLYFNVPKEGTSAANFDLSSGGDAGIDQKGSTDPAAQ